MTPQNLGQHILDILKGAVGAALVAASIAFLQYLGAHIPDMLTWLGSVAGGVGAIKIAHN